MALSAPRRAMAERKPGATGRSRSFRAPMGQTVQPSGVDDPQRKGLADRLRAVDDVELPQRLLHVVLHGERADLEDHADLDVALAMVDPLQDLLLARGEEPGLYRFHAGALERPGDLAAHPARVQRRNHQV